MMGSANTCSPFRYEINYRNYYLLTEGSAQIKLAPPHSIRYLYPNYDYENFEFRSPVDPWSPQPKYIADFDKMKCLEFTLTPGKTLYIPAYWWYSIKFNKNTSISCFNYRTYMNNVAVAPYIGMHALQIQNVKRNIVKKASIDELNKTVINNTQIPEKQEIQETNVVEQNLHSEGTSIDNLPQPTNDNNISSEI
jgi:hypothetical protein